MVIMRTHEITAILGNGDLGSKKFSRILHWLSTELAFSQGWN